MNSHINSPIASQYYISPYIITTKKPGRATRKDYTSEYRTISDAVSAIISSHSDEMDEDIYLMANERYDYDVEPERWAGEVDRLWAEYTKEIEERGSWEDGNGVKYSIAKKDDEDLINHLIDLLNECASNCSIEGHYYGPKEIWLDLEIINQACSDYGLTEKAAEELDEETWNAKVCQAAQWLAEDL